MKCSLKDGFINVLLIIFIAPSEGTEFPLRLRGSSVLSRPMNLQQFRASINRLQDLDSFPGNGENQLHRIVKKQMMTGSEYKEGRRSRRAVVSSPEIAGVFGAGDGRPRNVPMSFPLPRDDGKPEETAAIKSAFLKARSAGEATATESFLKRLKEFAKEKELLFLRGSKKIVKTEGKGDGRRDEDQVQLGRERENGRKMMADENETEIKHENSCLSKEYRRIPDQFDYRYYYECEMHPNGCLKLKHKRCPKGQFFSYKYLKCLKADSKGIKIFRRKKSTSDVPPKRIDIPEPNPEDPEPANEWLDANQGPVQKIPSEFKPKKKPDLKIYHLRVKRASEGRIRNDANDRKQEWDKSGMAREQISPNPVRGALKNAGIKRHHRPRSFVIHINRKEGKGDQITDSNENENDSDEDDEETDEEDDDEETDEEDEDSESEDPKEITQEKPHKETLKDLLKSAKEAVTNRARFEDPTQIAPRAIKEVKDNSSFKSKKSDDSMTADKKVLIDASIKVDSTLGSVLRSFLKNKKKDFESINKADDNEAFVSGRESQDKLDPELLRTYENLKRNNPRVKRYFLANCSTRRNDLKPHKAEQLPDKLVAELTGNRNSGTSR